MALIAKRACVIGDIGVIVSITWRQDVRGAIPREGMEVRSPKSATEFIDRPTLRSQWRFLFCPRKRKISEVAIHSKCEQSLAASVVAGDLFLVSQEDSVVLSDTGAAATLARFGWLAHHNRILARRGIPRAT